MTPLLLPAVPYDRTARRPAWADLPAAFRAALQARLGSEVVAAKVNRCGFTPGFAAALTLGNGEQHFVKALPAGSELAHWYDREAKVTAALPAGVPTARLRWHGELAGHVVLCCAAIPGARTPSLPWPPAQLAACLDALATAARALTEPGPQLLALQPESFGALLDTALRNWRRAEIAGHPYAGDLAALEQHFDNLTRHSTALIHCDLRLDNLAIDADGRAWICDWSFLQHGPPWFDLLTLLLSAEAGGHDVDALFFAHPLSAGLSPLALDCGLAAMLGYYRHSGAEPEIDTSPYLRAHQRYYGELTWRWLSRRQGWA